MISDGYKHNFEMLCKAIKYKDAALIECQDAVTKEPVIVIAAMQQNNDGTITAVPFAKMFDGNPYEELIPPDMSEIEGAGT